MNENEFEEHLDKEVKVSQIFIQLIKDYLIKENMNPDTVISSFGMILSELISCRYNERGIKIFIDSILEESLNMRRKFKSKQKRTWSKLRDPA